MAPLLTVEAPSAGAAPLDQILVVLAFTAVVYGALLWVLFRERTGRRTWVGALADRVGARDGSPRWFALPMMVQVAGALSGAVGLWWDVSFHISLGRDEGPLANPAHYLIFIGLIAILAGGALALALADDHLPRRTFAITRRWRVPFGPAVSTGISLCALLGFPLDDVWHRLFGQDVTEWGPTHVLMIGGVLMLPYSMLLTCAEARQISFSRLRRSFEWIALVVLAAGPVAFLLEFAYGVPQFPLLNDPVVMTVATVVTFTLTMLRGPRWTGTVWLAHAALQAALFGLNVLVFDALTPWPPLLLGGALVALALSRWARPTLGFGALAGVAMAVGMLAVEYFWTQLTRPIPWPAEMMPWALLFCGVTGAAVGVLATWMHQRTTSVADAAAPVPTGHRGAPGTVALAAATVVVGVFVVNVPPEAEPVGEVDVTVEEVSSGGSGKAGYLQVRLGDEVDVSDAYWFEALSWQGGGAVHGELVEMGPGVYRTDEPMPLHGSWKTMVRLHQPLHTLMAAPVYAPADPAIPAEAVPAVDGPREFIEESEFLRREEKPDVPGWLWGTAYVVVGGLFSVLFGLVGVGYAAAARPGRRSDDGPAPAPVRSTSLARVDR